ncbi:MAG: NAD-dependent deacylase [Anaerolineales bacterium]|jgi:NAD-dependent deacetylase
MTLDPSARSDTPSHLRLARELIFSSPYTVALTGAGISTPSGIPDFRSPGLGLWERVDPMEVASQAVFRYHPERFYEWIRPLAQGWMNSRPNAAHWALAHLEKAGRLQCVVTQNIDDLHQQAGSSRVLQIHGSFREAVCLNCYRLHGPDPLTRWLRQPTDVPRCEICGGVLKPNVILFGEQLSQPLLQRAHREFSKARLVLVVGSSLEVTPAAMLPMDALQHGAHLIIINRLPTYLDPRADVVLREDIAEVLPKLSDEALHVAL